MATTRARRPSSYTPLLSIVEQAALDGMITAGKSTLARAKELAPKDDKTLARSGRVTTDRVYLVEVTFRAPHAWLQHERLDYEHPNGGQAKYLEAALDEQDVAFIVGSAVKAALRG